MVSGINILSQWVMIADDGFSSDGVNTTSISNENSIMGVYGV
jgi:hypothetical protein